MDNSKFWNSKNGSKPNIINFFKSLFKKGSTPVVETSAVSNGVTTTFMKNNSKAKKIATHLGVSGAVVLSLLGVVLLIAYMFIIRPGYALKVSVDALKADGANILEAMRQRDLVALDKELLKTETDLNTLRQDRENKFGWARNAKIFKLNEFYSDTERFINAGFYAIDAIREIEKVVTPFADAAGLKIREDQQIIQSEGLMEAFQTWVSLMPQVAGQMDGVIEKVAKIGKELETVDTSKYPVSFRGVLIRENIEFAKNTLSNAGEYAPDIKSALTIFPRLLGVNTPVKRYMIIMQNDKEIRATGGFMTNYATFKIKDGLLQSDFSSKDMYSIDYALDIIDAYTDFSEYTTNAPSAYHKYLKLERWYVRDMNAFPDFVMSMQQFLKFYDWAGRINPYEIKTVDGIVAIDTNVISELLDVTGPVTVNGVTYDRDNVVLELERIASLALAEQVGRKKVLGDLMEAMLINLFESDKNLWSRIIEKGVSLANRKHVQIYLPNDADAQALIEKYNFAGRIKDPVVGDYLLANSTNLGGDKTNWFVKREISQNVAKENDKWVKTVSIKYTYPTPSEQYSPFIKRFRDWLRLYVPNGSQVISVEGTEDGTETGQESGKTFITGYIELGPEETKELKFKYVLPDNTVAADKYVLTLQKQAGQPEETYNITINGKTNTFKIDTDKKIEIRL